MTLNIGGQYLSERPITNCQEGGISRSSEYNFLQSGAHSSSVGWSPLRDRGCPGLPGLPLRGPAGLAAAPPSEDQARPPRGGRPHHRRDRLLQLLLQRSGPGHIPGCRRFLLHDVFRTLSCSLGGPLVLLNILDDILLVDVIKKSVNEALIHLRYQWSRITIFLFNICILQQER